MDHVIYVKGMIHKVPEHSPKAIPMSREEQRKMLEIMANGEAHGSSQVPPVRVKIVGMSPGDARDISRRMREGVAYGGASYARRGR